MRFGSQIQKQKIVLPSVIKAIQLGEFFHVLVLPFSRQLLILEFLYKVTTFIDRPHPRPLFGQTNDRNGYNLSVLLYSLFVTFWVTLRLHRRPPSRMAALCKFYLHEKKFYIKTGRTKKTITNRLFGLEYIYRINEFYIKSKNKTNSISKKSFF